MTIYAASTIVRLEAEIEDKEASIDMMRSRLGERETLLRQCREQNERLKTQFQRFRESELRKCEEAYTGLLDKWAVSRAEIGRLREALLNVSVHTAHANMAPDQLHVDLLTRISEITRAALAGKPRD